MRDNDVDDVVVLNADEDTFTSLYTDVQLLPLDVVSHWDTDVISHCTASPTDVFFLA